MWGGPGGGPGPAGSAEGLGGPGLLFRIGPEVVWDAGLRRGGGQVQAARRRPRPGSHHGGAWLGARVWFEISATGPGLPRALAAGSG